MGYLINHPKGIRGQQGVGYDYVVAGNGIFVQAENPTLTARVQITDSGLKGLTPTEPKVILPKGKIPVEILLGGIHWFQQTPETERYFAVVWDGRKYTQTVPEQEGTRSSLSYQTPGSAVLEFHSHGRLRAFFSQTDDRDEQGFRIYGVAGRLDQRKPEMTIRVGIYGHFQEIDLKDVFH